MADIRRTLDGLMNLEGAMCAAVVDYNSGMMLGSAGSGLDMEVASAGTTEVVRAQMNMIDALGLHNEIIDDMLISLGTQYHIIRPSARNDGVFLYLVLDRKHGNLAMARRKTQDADKDLVI